MKSTKSLRLRLRLMEGALLLFFAVFTTAAVSTHQLLLDAANHPTSDFNLTSTHVLGTLDAARLPASVPLFDGANDLPLAHGLIVTQGLSAAGNAFSVNANGGVSCSTLSASGLQLDTAASVANAIGGYIDTVSGGYINTTEGGYIDTSFGGGAISTSNGGGILIDGSIDTSNGGGHITTSTAGGYIVTNGYGAPGDSSAPIGSIYMDQDPFGGSGSTLWVMQSDGNGGSVWVGH